ncbi:MAG: RtcB family protein [Pseudomonadota bacterium]
MDTSKLHQISEYAWRLPPEGTMRVPAVIYADDTLINDMDEKVCEQAMNVATLPGIVGPCYAMPDAHWGYGFPIGGVAAFDPGIGGVVSAGGVGFDISCGVRTLRTGLKREVVEPFKSRLADALYQHIPAGLGSEGQVHLTDSGMTEMLKGGARWAVEKGFGTLQDLERIEERGKMHGAEPAQVSSRARKRQRNEMGTLGSGNHYLEVQCVSEVFDADAATAFGIGLGDVLISIHCGSRGLGHQIGTEFLKSMQVAAGQYGITLPDRELACAPIESPVGQSYLGAMRAAINCALANRQIITHLTREVFADVLPEAFLELIYDVSHNTCKVEEHIIDGKKRRVYVHRKGATRAFGPGHPDLPEVFRASGQPVIIGGSMGTSSYLLAGSAAGERLSLSSACHGAGRSMSRHQAYKKWRGREVVDSLAAEGIIVRSPSSRGVAEEAPGAYKNVDRVVQVSHRAGLARLVAKLVPLVCIKG